MAAAAGEAARPFDLVQGPLIRAVLLRLSPEDHLVALTLHHIVSDGWSMAIIIRELAALYNAFVSGSESPLPPLLLQYADYAIYQRNWLDSGVMAKQLAYWTEHFAEMPPSLEIPLDRDRPSMQSFQADRVGLFIDSRLTEPLRALAQRRRDSFHGASSGLQGSASSVFGRNRHLRRHTDSQPEVGRDGRAHWVLPEHPGSSH